MSRKLGAYLVLFLFSWQAILFAAYSEKVAVSKEEFMNAAKIVLQEYGVSKEKLDKGEIESNWNYDWVTRSKGPLRNVIKQRYKRRYRIRIKVQPEGQELNVKVKGQFEIQSGSSPAASWRKVKARAGDHQIEREVFFKVLTEIENQRNKSTQSPPATAV